MQTCFIFLIVAIILVILLFFVNSSKEMYASQIAHAYAGNIAGPMPDYVRYPWKYQLPSVNENTI